VAIRPSQFPSHSRAFGGVRDRFYDGVAARADPLIDQWKRETAEEEET